MTEKNSCATEDQRAADRKVRKQDYMVIGLGLLLLILSKVLA
ncbi:hypothetical protein [Desulforamulus putei]|uniref:Uncharacterized protein n=1 Tax=Desulforamulus putei DSM 12395 TaxID=1121429 RepID=A0A1M4T515_9FIRM|nr:hypothetical protein [Desulforamulus putei]SHE39458.1 hypothetical protein SAMN02745133_00352 [Desulforamulus putei DSM 12395]